MEKEGFSIPAQLKFLIYQKEKAVSFKKDSLLKI